MDQGGQKHRRIGGSARYDHVSTSRQGLYNRPSPKVGIGRDEPVAERGDSLPGVVEEVAARAHCIEHIISCDGGDLQTAKPQCTCNRRCFLGSCDRVGSAHVGYDLDALRVAGTEHSSHPIGKEQVVA